MKLLNKLTIKNLKLNKKRTCITVVGVVLSIALITAISSIFFSFYNSLLVSEKEQSGNFHYGFLNVPINDIKYFKENRHFEEVFLIKNIGFAKLNDCENLRKPYASFMALDQTALSYMEINLIKGRLPQNEEEILIPKHLATSGHIYFEIGDTIEFQVGKRAYESRELEYYDEYNGEEEELINTITKRYKVVGLIERPIVSLEPYDSPGFTFITLLSEKDYISKIDIYTRYTKESLKNEINISADILGVDCSYLEYIYQTQQVEYTDEERAIFESMGKNLKYYPNKNVFLVDLESGMFMNGDTKIIGYATIVLIIIIVIASIFCIRNSFNISITEKTRQYGMLSTIGATSKQIKKNVYYEALVITLISIPLGIVVSIILSYLIVISFNELAFNTLGFNLEYSFSLFSLLLSIILGFIIIFLSAWQSAFTASHISPIEAIVNSEKIKIKKTALKTPKIIKNLFGIGGIISSKNLQRSKKRYRPTIIMLVICASIFIALSTFLQITFSNISSGFKKEEYNVAIGYNLTANPRIE
ncbi:MAG: ABC transporter permease, partial [Bacilli bacterium]|nr:ABC transporter permease [Bacilli bacterium]